VSGIQWLKLPRVIAVLCVSLIAFLIIAALSWVLAAQLLDLANDLPQYKQNLMSKVRLIRSQDTSGLNKTTETVQDLNKELSKRSVEKTGSTASPTPVQIVEPPPTAVHMLGAALGPLIKPLGTSAVVILFTIFMLIKREDLRDRIIRLIGPSNISVTTQALDEAADRVSRYLLMQSIINCAQGTLVATGLYFIGIPNALLWGALSAVLRFIPYVGPWLAAAMPIALSFAIFTGWTQPVLTIALFVVLELITANLVEPWLYGAKTGVSSVALIIAAVFWTWLWGTAGLLLSAPLTVCLVVLGKYAPQFQFLEILLGDQPALDLHTRFYQRLLAFDSEEAGNLLEENLETKSLLMVCDEIIIPALSLAETDRHKGILSEKQESYVLDNALELFEELHDVTESKTEKKEPVSDDMPAVLCLPARDEADEIAATLFVQLLKDNGIRSEVIKKSVLAGEIVQQIEAKHPQIVLISALPPAAVTQTRYLCKRLRGSSSDLSILVGLWNAQGNINRAMERLSAVGMNFLVTNFNQAIEQIRQIELSRDPVGARSLAYSTTE
jgi:predicted PurR-regulated permease PerM